MKCEWCGNEFTPTGGWEQRFCCDLHRNAWNRRRRRQEAVEAAEDAAQHRSETNGQDRGTPEEREQHRQALAALFTPAAAQREFKRRV